MKKNDEAGERAEGSAEMERGRVREERERESENHEQDFWGGRRREKVIKPSNVSVHDLMACFSRRERSKV